MQLFFQFPPKQCDLYVTKNPSDEITAAEQREINQEKDIGASGALVRNLSTELLATRATPCFTASVLLNMAVSH